MTDLIVPAIGNALLGNYPPDSTMARGKQRSAAVSAVRSIVGKAVYWGRRPEPQGHSAITLRTISDTPTYELLGEVHIAQPVIEVSVFTKGGPPKTCATLVNHCRLALSNYRGWLMDSDRDLVFVHGATVINSQMDPASYPAEWGEYWAFAAGFDIQVSHDKTVVKGTCDGVYG